MTLLTPSVSACVQLTDDPQAGEEMKTEQNGEDVNTEQNGEEMNTEQVGQEMKTGEEVNSWLDDTSDLFSLVGVSRNRAVEWSIAQGLNLLRTPFFKCIDHIS